MQRIEQAEFCLGKTDSGFARAKAERGGLFAFLLYFSITWKWQAQIGTQTLPHTACKNKTGGLDLPSFEVSG